MQMNYRIYWTGGLRRFIGGSRGMKLMDFMKMIKETECHLKRYIKDNQSHHFLVLGGGIGAKGIIRFLKANNKNFKVSVEQKYWREGLYIEGD